MSNLFNWGSRLPKGKLIVTNRGGDSGWGYFEHLVYLNKKYYIYEDLEYSRHNYYLHNHNDFRDMSELEIRTEINNIITETSPIIFDDFGLCIEYLNRYNTFNISYLQSLNSSL
jgi:hypothetical protein